MIYKVFLRILVCAAVFGYGVGPAAAADPKLIARHDKWGSYVIHEKGGKVCYMASSPDKQDARLNGKNRGDVYALVTNRPDEGTKNVFTYIAGYTYKQGSEASVTIDGGKPFPLFTKGDSAWARKSDVDNRIAGALRKGSVMIVRGASSHGTHTVDSFSLKGAGSAWADIDRECSGNRH